MNERLKPILVIAATAGTILVNWMAAKGYINNVTPEIISDKYPTFITPAGYAFAIWSLIYLDLIAFSIYQALPSKLERFRPVRTIYILSCVANCAWIYFWLHEMILVCLGVIFVLLGTLVFINLKLRGGDSAGENWLARVPFGVYFGWVTVAATLNFAVALVYLNVKFSDSAAIITASILIALVTILGIIMRIKLAIYVFPLPVAWALTAIAVEQSGKTPIVATAAFGVIFSLVAALSFVMDMKSSEIK
jgi:purine-cytosine permease-like protein